MKFYHPACEEWMFILFYYNKLVGVDIVIVPDAS